MAGDDLAQLRPTLLRLTPRAAVGLVVRCLARADCLWEPRALDDAAPIRPRAVEVIRALGRRILRCALHDDGANCVVARSGAPQCPHLFSARQELHQALKEGGAAHGSECRLAMFRLFLTAGDFLLVECAPPPCPAYFDPESSALFHRSPGATRAAFLEVVALQTVAAFRAWHRAAGSADAAETAARAAAAAIHRDLEELTKDAPTTSSRAPDDADLWTLFADELRPPARPSETR